MIKTFFLLLTFLTASTAASAASAAPIPEYLTDIYGNAMRDDKYYGLRLYQQDSVLVPSEYNGNTYLAARRPSQIVGVKFCAHIGYCYGYWIQRHEFYIYNREGHPLALDPSDMHLRFIPGGVPTPLNAKRISTNVYRLAATNIGWFRLYNTLLGAGDENNTTDLEFVPGFSKETNIKEHNNPQ